MSQPDQIDLTAEEKSYLQALIDAKKVSPRVSDRAKILLLRSEGVSPSEIRRKLHMLSKPVRLCLDKFKEGGLMRALQDAYWMAKEKNREKYTPKKYRNKSDGE